MNIHSLMFGWEFPPKHSGGLGVACEGLVKGLLKNGVKITLVLPHASTAKHDNLEIRAPSEDLYNTIRVESALLPYDDFASFEQRLHAGKKDYAVDDLYGPDLGAAVELFTRMSVPLTKNTNPDVVHTHDWMTYEAGFRAARYHGKPLVAHIHATEFDRTDFHPNPWIAERERIGLLRSDHVIAVSNYTKNLLIKHYGVPADKISVVHNGHEHKHHNDHARPGHRPPLVLFLGRLTVQKNPWQFLDVARRIVDHRGDVRFVMAGDGPMLNKLVDRACDLGLSEHVVFAGKVSQREANSLFSQANCFVMPSLSEPFGLVALEAVGHGVPVVLSRQSGACEVIDHAFKVDFWDTDKMADCILTVLREAPLASQLKSEAPRVLQRLTWQNQAHIIRSMYINLLRS